MGLKNGMIHPIMVIGHDKLAYSIVSDLLLSGHPALLLTDNRQAAVEAMQNHVPDDKQLHIISDWPDTIYSQLVILVTADRLKDKQELVRQLEARCPEDTIIAINLESICLHEVQIQMNHKARLVGLNWTYPAYRTFFSEIITNADTHPTLSATVVKWLKTYWKKDPYVVQQGFSIRARMMAAMLREGLYLVENDFASIESVDRACRNDAGFYLPFVGNFRYMDLMGTYAYGRVMKDLNRELSNTTALPGLLKEKKVKGETGMDSGKGFYTYAPEEQKRWQIIFNAFSAEIQQLINKYAHESFDR